MRIPLLLLLCPTLLLACSDDDSAPTATTGSVAGSSGASGQSGAAGSAAGQGGAGAAGSGQGGAASGAGGSSGSSGQGGESGSSGQSGESGSSGQSGQAGASGAGASGEGGQAGAAGSAGSAGEGGAAGNGGNAGGAAGAGGGAGGGGAAGQAGAGQGGSSGSSGQSGEAKLQIDWSKRFGNENTQGGEHVALDDGGDVLLSGIFRDAIDLGGGPITNETDGPFGETAPAGYLARFTDQGNHVFSQGLGQAKGSLALEIAARKGSLYVIGQFGKEVDLGKGLLASGIDNNGSNNDAFIASYGASGATEWANVVGQKGLYASAGGLAVDAQGRATVAGQIQGETTLGPASPSVEQALVWMATLAGGQVTQAQVIGGSTGVTVKGLAPRAAGGVVMVAELFGQASLGGEVFEAPADKRIIVAASFDEKGKLLWSTPVKDEQSDLSATAISLGSDGKVWISGYATAYLPDDSYDSDVLIASFDEATGAKLWERRLTGEGNQYAWSLAALPSGGALAVGSFVNKLVSGDNELATSAGDQDAFVVYIDEGGNPRLETQWGGPQDQVALDVAAAPSGQVAFTGYFSGEVDFGNGPLQSVGAPGNSDAFLVVGKFAP